MSLEEEMLRLRKENELLRQQLALYQQTVPVAPEASAVAAPVLERPVESVQPADEGGILWPTPGEAFWERAPRTSPAPLAPGGSSQPPAPRDPQPLHIVHLTAEMAPIAKVGGLGDVVTGLARAALSRGHNVAVMLPFYQCLPPGEIEGLKHEMDVDVPKGYRWDGEMRGGIVYSNAVTTVSPTYAQEVLDGGAAGWLRSTFARPELRSKFHGILNGIDYSEWDPASDPLLPANFDAERPAGKAACKEFLQRGLGLEVNPRKPLVAVVSRLVPQKGIHLIRAALFRTLEAGGQFVLLGSGHSDPPFRQLAEGQFRDHPDVRLKIMYSERLAHQIYGAADVVVVPSMFEPCGLTQMIALRYGAVPLVRRTGGLADTVFDVDGPAAPPGSLGRNGFTFDGSDDGSLRGALDRALALYREQPGRWEALSRGNMRLDVSWAKSAQSYVDVYNSIAVRN
ncbi:hypothetical protein GPECTOR_9g438 [Gonium pectorale]|uniref:Starch synthase, chloroplastic/amyloplastic n=1 Tax=Gonium pectorale TaxID=33097 RepID=A0A150GRH6_GONPE|nr:hypothetical protein GPECTOR_9g438 [Gonium pectorale]|eukprot:KXZ52394.1 hypothetical protein GPECTOR_9g438 [Gonium pectorale]